MHMMSDKGSYLSPASLKPQSPQRKPPIVLALIERNRLSGQSQHLRCRNESLRNALRCQTNDALSYSADTQNCFSLRTLRLCERWSLEFELVLFAFVFET